MGVTHAPQPTGAGDVAVLALTLASAAVFVVVYVVLWVARARLAFVRAKNLSMLGLQTFASVTWMLCSLVSNEHFEGARAVHMRACGAFLVAHYGFGVSLWLGVLLLRLYDAWSTWTRDRMPTWRTRACVLALACGPTLVACTVAFLTRASGPDAALGACITAPAVKWTIMGLLLASYLAFLVALRTTWGVPREFDDSRALQLAARLLAPFAGLAAVLIMSDAWTDESARALIGLCVLVCCWAAFGAVVFPVLRKLRAPRAFERQFMEFADVYVGPMDDFAEVLAHRSSRDHLHTWLGTEAAPVLVPSGGQLRPCHLAAAHAMALAHADVARGDRAGMPAGSAAAAAEAERIGTEFVRLFVGPTAPCRLPLDAGAVHALLRCAKEDMRPVIALAPMVRWTQGAITQHYSNQYMTNANVRAYYEGVMRTDAAIQSLRERSLLPAPPAP